MNNIIRNHVVENCNVYEINEFISQSEAMKLFIDMTNFGIDKQYRSDPDRDDKIRVKEMSNFNLFPFSVLQKINGLLKVLFLGTHYKIIRAYINIIDDISIGHIHQDLHGDQRVKTMVIYLKKPIPGKITDNSYLSFYANDERCVLKIKCLERKAILFDGHLHHQQATQDGLTSFVINLILVK